MPRLPDRSVARFHLSLYAAFCSLEVGPSCMIAQTKPASSRATAVIATCRSFPRFTKCQYRWWRRFIAFCAKATTHGGWPSHRALSLGLVRGLVDTVAFCPPLIITESEIDEMFDRFARALDETEGWVRKNGLGNIS